ncbi:MAG: hypothetical protein QM628_16450 [Propionicimonas sp.]
MLTPEVINAWTAGMDTAQTEFVRDEFKPGYRDAVVTVDPSVSRWWTVPVHGDRSGRISTVLGTTRGPWLGTPCVGAFGEEDSSFDSPWADEHAHKDPDAIAETSASLGLRWRKLDSCIDQPRVFEITSTEDWITLTNFFPHVTHMRQLSRHGRQASTPWRSWLPPETLFVEPDWAAVATQYDAVHLTQLAYVTAAYTPIHCDQGLSLITGWGPDQTRWLTDPRPEI